MMRARPPLLYAAIAALALLVGVGALLLNREEAPPESAQSTTMRAGAYDPPQSAPEFSLVGSDGAEVSLARYRGKVVLMSFGFTHCAAVCPTTLATLSAARDSMGADADSVQVIFVTVDPSRDNADHMRDYVSAFGDGIVGATGTEEALAAVREDYGVTAIKQGDGPDYAMAHTSSIFLIDAEGQLRGMMPYGRDPADFVHDIRLLLES